MRELGNVLRVAWADYATERLMSICFVMVLAAVMTPLLVLFGIKFGVVSTLVGRLVEDPRNREIIPIGGGRFDAAWFAAMASRPTVAFVLPKTRSIAASIDLRRDGDDAMEPIRADLIPTAKGDPILEKWARVPSSANEIVLSDVVARKLHAAVGAVLDGSIGRIRNGVAEDGHLRETVVAVLPPTVTERAVAYVPLDVVVAFEDFRDDRAVASLGWVGDAPPSEARVFSSYRLFVRRIDDVAPLRDELTAVGLNLDTRAEEIENVQSLDRMLSLVFRIIAGLGGSGFIIAFGINLFSNVERKRRSLSVLRLVGFTPLGVTLFQMSQAAVTAVLGAALSIALYEVAQAVINTRFAPTLLAGEVVCRLLPVHFVIAALITMASAQLAATAAGIKAAFIEPAEGLRDV